MKFKVGDYVQIKNPDETYTQEWCKDNHKEYFERYGVVYKKPWNKSYSECEGKKGIVVSANGLKVIVKYEDNYAFAIDPHGLALLGDPFI